MSTDATQDERQEEAPPIVHDDIVQRLLEYQAQLREGIKEEETQDQPITPTPAKGLIDYSALETPAQVEEIVDVATAEAVDAEGGEIVQLPESATTEVVTSPKSAPAGDLASRVSVLEEAVVTVASSLAELRIQAQDSALSIDDRLAELIEKLDAIAPPPASDVSS